MATLAEAIMATTPQDVYDKLCTIYEDAPVWPEDGTLCPLHTFFAETYPDEAESDGLDDDGVCVSMEDVRIGEYHSIPLPTWMTDYQDEMISRRVSTMGKAVAVLQEMYGVE